MMITILFSSAPNSYVKHRIHFYDTGKMINQVGRFFSSYKSLFVLNAMNLVEIQMLGDQNSRKFKTSRLITLIFDI